VLNTGVIEQVGSPLDLYHHPANLFVAGFIGSPKMNFLTTAVEKVGESGITVKLPGGASLEVPAEPNGTAAGSAVTLGMRPEHLQPGAEGPMKAEVLVVERLGGTTYLHARIEGGDLFTVQAGGEDPVRMHDRIALNPDAGHCHLFDAAGKTLKHLERHPLADVSTRAKGAAAK
jgi:multiple sugar transport system ATP-binding protein